MDTDVKGDFTRSIGAEFNWRSWGHRSKRYTMLIEGGIVKKLVEEEDMISPFVDKSVSQGISHGLNSFGYDLRCGDEFKIFTNIKGAVADPKNFTEDNLPA